MTTLRWTPEMLAAHTARMKQTVDAAPKPLQAAVDQEPKKRRQKYGNKVTTDADDTKHASKKQATRYRDLGLLLKSGEILMLAREVRFRLPGGVEYRADHVFCNQRALMVIAELIKDGDMTVEDVKSEATRKDKVYKIKARQMRECLGIAVKEV
ncbi:MAG: DUF1064 domain-containing protein [Gallionella sp.]|nr:DUF1064 domain-containing protein [Gallionella sp.]